MKTPIKQDLRDPKNLRCSQTKISINPSKYQDSQKSTTRGDIKGNHFDRTAPLDQLYNSIDTSQNPRDQQYYSRQSLDGDVNQDRFESRDRSQNIVDTRAKYVGESEVKVYVVKNKKQNQSSQLKVQLQSQNLQSDKTKRQQELHDDTKSAKSTRREDSKSRYSAVKSKVRTNLRSKTPVSKGPQLSKEQQMEQKERKVRREQDITYLENQVHKIEHDLNYRQNNKELILETYKESKKQKSRKNTDPQLQKSQIQSENGSEHLQDSTDESSHRVNIKSKKQFNQQEYEIQNFRFSDKYFDKVYLELCGFTDLEQGKSQLIEIEKQSNLKQTYCLNEITSPRTAIQVVNNCDIVASVIFFEKRTDKAQRRFDSEIPEPADEFYEDQQNQDNESPTQVRRIEDNEREDDFMMDNDRREVNEDISSRILMIGDEDARKKREELRNQNQQLVNDFQNTYQDLIEQRKTHSHMAFYEAINEYNYDKKQLDNAVYRDPDGSFQLAQSPTKRLICMKNNQMEHIKQIKDRNLLSNNKQTSMVYMASPERSYVVKSDQKIDYSLAFKKNPSKFYEEALTAPITKHKIQQQRQSISPKNDGGYEKKSTLGSQASSLSSKNFMKQTSNSNIKRKKDHEVYTIVSKNTTRPHNRINTKIKQKIEQKLSDKLGQTLTQQVLKALEEANLQEAINDLISQSQKDKDDNPPIATKFHKTMSVQSLPIKKFDVEGNRQEIESGCGEIQNEMKRNDSSSVRNPITRELRTNTNVKIVNDISGRMSSRSGISSKQYNTENNNIEEGVSINRAYQ